MINTRVDGQPITYSGQTSSFSSGVTNVNDPNTFVDIDQREITTPNPNPLDTFYPNLATGAFGNRGKINPATGLVQNSYTNGVISPIIQQ